MTARAEIVAVAAREFAARGYHAVSMRDLARSTGRSPATFYSHFRSKEELLFSMQRDAFDELIARAEAAVAKEADPEERLRAFVDNHIDWFAAHPDLMRVLVHEAASLPPRSRAPVRRRKERYFELARSIISGVLGDADPRAVERATWCVFGMLNWTYTWYDRDAHGPPAEVAHTLFDLCAGGLRAAARRSP